MATQLTPTAPAVGGVATASRGAIEARIGGQFGPEQTLVDYGLARLWFGHAIFSTAVVTLVVRPRMAGADGSLEEAAADLYAGRLTRFRQITLLQVWPAIAAAFMLAFSLSMDDTMISSFVSVTGSSPWPCLLALTAMPLALVGAVLRQGSAQRSTAARGLPGDRH